MKSVRTLSELRRMTAKDYKLLSEYEKNALENSAPFKELQKEFKDRIESSSAASAAINEAFQLACNYINDTFKRLHGYHNSILRDMSLRTIWKIEASCLYTAIINSDDCAANEIMSSKNFGLPVLKNLVTMASMDEKERTEDAKKTASEFQMALEKINQISKKRTERARETKKNQSNIPKIILWFKQMEKSGKNINDRDVSSVGAKKFDLSKSYIAKVRRDYLA